MFVGGLEDGLVGDLLVIHGGQLSPQSLEALLQVSTAILLQFVVHLPRRSTPVGMENRGGMDIRPLLMWKTASVCCLLQEQT